MKSFICSALFLFSGIALISGCGSPEPNQKVSLPNPYPPPVAGYELTCGGKIVGSVRTSVCAPGYEGSKSEVCTDRGDFAEWVVDEAGGSCRVPPSRCNVGEKRYATFEDIKPLIVDKCVECHGNFVKYGPAASIAKQAAGMFGLGSNDRLRMPPPPLKQALTDGERELWDSWIDGSLLEKSDCDDVETRSELDYNTNAKFTSNNLKATLSLDGIGQGNARFLTADTKYNAGSTAEEMGIFRGGINKAINAINAVDKNLFFCQSVDKINGACRVDLELLGISPAIWDEIVLGTTLLYIDDTDEGRLLRELTGTDYPSLTGDQFIEGILFNPELYFKVMGIPYTLEEYWVLKGVDFQRDIEAFRARFSGMAVSDVSNGKNRQIMYFDSDDGVCSITFDPLDLGIAESNLPLFPLLGIGERRFKFDATEVICPLPNGELENTLWNEAGIRQAVAPEDIVHDFRGVLLFGDNEILTPGDCYACHSGGLNIYQDDIKRAVADNQRDFSAQDKQFVDALYPSQTGLNGIFFSFNDAYNKRQAIIGVDTLKDDPINYYEDRFRLPWTVDSLCGHIRLPLEDCIPALKSTSVSGEISPMFVGGTVNKDILNRVFDTIVDELGIGLNPLDRRLQFGDSYFRKEDNFGRLLDCFDCELW